MKPAAVNLFPEQYFTEESGFPFTRKQGFKFLIVRQIFNSVFSDGITPDVGEDFHGVFKIKIGNC